MRRRRATRSPRRRLSTASSRPKKSPTSWPRYSLPKRGGFTAKRSRSAAEVPMADSMDLLRKVEPEGWPPPLGYANGLCTPGQGERLLFVAGQVGWHPDGTFTTDDLAE